MLHGYGQSLLEGMVATLAVAFSALAVALVLGMSGALAKSSKRRSLRWAANTYTTLVRGVPDLVLMLLIFYGGQASLNWALTRMGFSGGLDINPFIAGVATIGFIFGAYLTETFRGAMMAIPAGQREAGIAFGMTSAQVFRRITFPQMVRLAIPSFTNNWLVLVKSTALVSLIGLTDMMQRAQMAAGATREPFTFYVAVGVLYLVITTVSLIVLKAIEKKFSLGVRVAR